MPRALLLNPWIYDFAAFDMWSVPLGLLQLASILRQGGWEVDYLDLTDRFDSGTAPSANSPGLFNTGKYVAQEVPKPPALAWIPRKFKRYGIPPEVFREKLGKLSRPDVILVTSKMTYWYPGVAEAIRMAREVFPQAPVILGGAYATLMPGHAWRICQPGVLAQGEGEERLGEWIEAATGKPFATHAGQTGPRVKPDAPATFFRGPSDASGSREMDQWPPPAYDLLSSKAALGIETSRGCPYKCAYCASRILTPRRRRKSVHRVVDELAWMIRDLGAADIAFYDDALLLGAESHFIPIAEEVVRQGLRARFHSPNSLFAHCVSERAAEAMRAMNMATVRISLESSSAARLERLDRRIGAEHFLQAVRNLHRAGYKSSEIGVYVLAGLPEQPVEEVRQTLDFVADHGASPYLAEYSPIPGTREFARAAQAARMPIQDEPLLHNNSIFVLLHGELDFHQWQTFKQHAVKLRRKMAALDAAPEDPPIPLGREEMPPLGLT